CWRRLNKDSMAALSAQAPTRPIDPCRPAARRARAKAWERNWADSAGRRNTSVVEVLMATMRERQRAVRLYRGQIPSPGRPTVAWRQDRVQFWVAIARGAKTEDAAVDAGVSSPVGFRWFRHAGGGNPRLSPAGAR